MMQQTEDNMVLQWHSRPKTTMMADMHGNQRATVLWGKEEMGVEGRTQVANQLCGTLFSRGNDVTIT